MNFKEKVQSMSGKEIVMAMVNGLRKRHVEIDMGTFGKVRGGVCFGCAATNALCEIAGRTFTANVIPGDQSRAEFLGTDTEFLYFFEAAMDDLRQGDIRSYNYYAEAHGFTVLPENDNLPHLHNGFTESDLQDYEDYANSI